MQIKINPGGKTNNSIKLNITPEFIKLLSNIYYFINHGDDNKSKIKSKDSALQASLMVLNPQEDRFRARTTKRYKEQGFLVSEAEGQNLIVQDTPFLVRNRVGYAISVIPIGDKECVPQIIANNSQQYIKFKAKDEFISLAAYNREVEILIDCKYKQEVSMKFSMSKLLQKKFMVDKHEVYVTVMKEGLKRVAVISSRAVFRNMCRFDWRLTYVVGEVASDILLQPGVKMGLPFDLQDAQVALFTERGALSEKFKPQAIVQNSAISVWDVGVLCPEKKVNKIKLYSTRVKDVTMIDIRPNFTIKNMLPGKIQY